MSTRRYTVAQAIQATRGGRSLRCVACGWQAPEELPAGTWHDVADEFGDEDARIACWECQAVSFILTAAPAPGIVDVWGADALRDGFTPIPNTMFTLDLKPGELLVAIALAKHLRRPGTPVFPSVATIAALTGQHPKTVKNTLAGLQRRGLVGVERSRRRDGRMGVNRYSLDGLRDALNVQGQSLPLDPGTPGATTLPARGNHCPAEVDVGEEDALPRRTTSEGDSVSTRREHEARAGGLAPSLDGDGSVVPFPAAEGRPNGSPEEAQVVRLLNGIGGAA